MQDEDINLVLRLVKKSVRQWPDPFIVRLAGNRPDPFLILVACILSLRTRDQTVADASERLFRLASDPFLMSGISLGQIEKAIFPVGFYRTKAKQIQGLSKKICQEYEGSVPSTIEALVELPGVGRKTANLVRTMGYSKQGICVDIHVHRICNRLGYVATKSPDETEMVLRQKLPEKYWIGFNGMLVPFGQNQCTPVSPRCSSCPICRFCLRVDVRGTR
jgi:endonuclease-3